jgi:membrane-bound lytic murein transglycosylase F
MLKLQPQSRLLGFSLPAVMLLALSLLTACQPGDQPALPDWRAGELVVLEDASESSADAEFNHDLAMLFATELQLKLKVIPVEVAQTSKALVQHRAHLAAIGMRSNDQSTGLIFAPSYQSLTEHLVFNDALVPPKSIEHLLKLKIAVAAGSAQESVLREIQLKQPLLRWESRADTNVDELLDEVASGTLDATFANQQQFALAKNFHENLSAAEFSYSSNLAWAFATDSDPELRKRAVQFFAEIRKDGRLHGLLDRYYGFHERLTAEDAAKFLQEIDTTLPRYQTLFEEAAHRSGVAWQWIAALAYQESHWNPLATSPTNVRGMMMLTEDTADQLNVENRLDARQSTLAGARYLASIREQLSLRIAEPDRTWMALAAYNQGFGHLEDARVLTQRMGMNADRWVDVKKWMPKLSQPQYFDKLKHGYARGGEAVILVENIRMYFDMLNRTKSVEEAGDLPITPYYQLLDSGKKPRIKNFSQQ